MTPFAIFPDDGPPVTVRTIHDRILLTVANATVELTDREAMQLVGGLLFAANQARKASQ